MLYALQLQFCTTQSFYIADVQLYSDPAAYNICYFRHSKTTTRLRVLFLIAFMYADCFKGLSM